MSAESADDYVVTLEMQSQYCGLVTVGCTHRRAAALIGVPESTIRSTIDRDPEFEKRVRKAVISRDLVPLNHIRNAQEKSWRAAAWMMERINPHDFSRRWPRQPTAAEMSDLLNRFSNAIITEVPAPELRITILEKLKQIVQALAKAPDIWQRDPPVKRDAHSPTWIDNALRRARQADHADNAPTENPPAAAVVAEAEAVAADVNPVCRTAPAEIEPSTSQGPTRQAEPTNEAAAPTSPTAALRESPAPQAPEDRSPPHNPSPPPAPNSPRAPTAGHIPDRPDTSPTSIAWPPRTHLPP